LKHLHLAAVITFILFIGSTPAAAVSPAIPAKAAIVTDGSGAVLYAKYPDAKLAPASTVKLITAMVAIDSLDPARMVKISRTAAKVRSIQPRLHADEEMTVSDLLHLALMKSINAAAVALAEAAAGSEQDFVALMNRKAEEIGANSTLFANASGLPKGTQYTTASDLVVIMKAALAYPLIREILGTKFYMLKTAEGREIFLDNSDDLLWQRENVTVIGGKTGYTGNARHCFVCAINTENGPLFTAVLGARSRSSLWKSTLLLAEIGTHPEEMAFPKEKHRTPRRVLRSGEKLNRSSWRRGADLLAFQEPSDDLLIRSFPDDDQPAVLSILCKGNAVRLSPDDVEPVWALSRPDQCLRPLNGAAAPLIQFIE
jgi:D-alanyl-D-alanine carboxypeptidase (penicillin-binding protein 5/6)